MVMEEIKEKIEQDLTYYQSGIRQLYMKSYQRYILLILALMVLTGIAIGAADILLRMILVVLFLFEAGGLVYVLRLTRKESFETYFQQVLQKLPQQFDKMKNIEPQEDPQAYYFVEGQELFVKLAKKNTRNFPSKIRQYTLLVGFTNDFGMEQLAQPLQFFYYDITRIKHADGYKKERLKNTDFTAKRNKRRIKSGIITLIVLALLGTVLYSYTKSYFEEEDQYYYDYDIEDEY
jgi:flagellar basal body-associated protein FliL